MTLSGSSNPHCPISSFSSSSSSNNTKSNNNDSNSNNGTNYSGNNNNNNNGQNGKGNDNSGNNKGGNNKGSSKTGIIAGVTIAAFIAIFFSLLSWFFIRRQKRRGSGGVKENLNGWSIDRNDSLKVGGGRTRLQSDPSENDITPFTLPQDTYRTPPLSSHGYSDIQPSPFISESERLDAHGTESPRGTFYMDNVESEADYEDAYALDAFRTSGIGSSVASQTRTGQASQSSQLRVVNDDGDQRGPWHETKGSLVQNTGAQQQRQVFQHEDSGIGALDEIPPAYPGPSSGFSGR
jgi:hypothetical protein